MSLAACRLLRIVIKVKYINLLYLTECKGSKPGIHNPDLIEEFSKQLGIDWKYTPSHSPHSNWSCERNRWTVDRKFEKLVKDTKGKVDLQRCLARAIFAANNTPKESGFTPSQIVLGYAPKPLSWLYISRR